MTESTYEFLTAEQFAHAIAAAPTNTIFDFTFDQSIDGFVCGQPTGWHGAKITEIFDEHDGVFAVGYYGGGDTRVYDIYKEWSGENIDHCIEEALETYAFAECQEGKLFCVEVGEWNQEYIKKVVSKND